MVVKLIDNAKEKHSLAYVGPLQERWIKNKTKHLSETHVMSISLNDTGKGVSTGKDWI